MPGEINQIIEQLKKETDFFNKAKLLKFLTQEKQIPIKDISSKVGLKPSYICHILRLNRLPEIVTDGYYSQMVSISHLFIISRLKDKAMIIKVYEKLLKDNLTVIQIEELVRELLYGIKNEGQFLAKKELENFQQKINKLEKNISSKIIQTRIRSKIIVEKKGSLAETTPFLKEILTKLV